VRNNGAMKSSHNRYTPRNASVAPPATNNVKPRGIGYESSKTIINRPATTIPTEMTRRSGAASDDARATAPHGQRGRDGPSLHRRTRASGPTIAWSRQKIKDGGPPARMHDAWSG